MAKAMGVSRSSLYYVATQDKKDWALKVRMEEELQKHPSYGARRLAQALSVMGRDKRVRIVTFVDRKSGYLIAYLLPKMRAELLVSLAIARFRCIPKEKRRTLTLDNGTEFSDWERLEEKSGMVIYFAYPYHAWERGTNENTNGLLRQYFPKDLDFNLITAKELAHIVRILNDRPRKRLKFKSPRQIFHKD